ncbi:MAG: hypothetical protein V1660_02630, partial [archaeon]
MKTRQIREDKRSQMQAAAIMVLIVMSSLVVAANISVNNPLMTGFSVADFNLGNLVENSTEILVFADTLISVISNKEGSAVISLRMDNGTSIPFQEIHFYQGGNYYSNETNELGIAEFSASEGVFFISYWGNESIYLNPSNLSYSEEKKESLIKNFWASKTEGKIGEEATLNVKLSDTKNYSVKFAVMHVPSGKVNEYTISEADSERTYSLKILLENPREYIWKAFYVMDGENVVDFNLPDISIKIREKQMTLNISNVLIESITKKKFNITASINAEEDYNERIVLRLKAPEEISLKNEITEINGIDANETTKRSFILDASRCGKYNLELVLSNSEKITREIILDIPCNNIEVNIETIQLPAEIGKPVKWKKIVEISNPTGQEQIDRKIDVQIPSSAKLDSNSIDGSFSLFSASINEGKYKNVSIDVPSLLPEENRTFIIEYETAAPSISEVYAKQDELSADEAYRKKILIGGSDEIHYENIRVSLKFEESLYGWVYLKWVNGSIRYFNEETVIYDATRNISLEQFNVSFEDSDNNGLYDTMVFYVPMLSGQEFSWGAYTCQQFLDSVAWSAGASKAGISYKYFQWSFENSCPGQSQCFIRNISAYATFTSVGSTGATVGQAYMQIANKDQTNCSVLTRTPTFTYYNAYSPAMGLGNMTGPLMTCEANYAGSPNACVMDRSYNFNGTVSEFNCTTALLYSSSDGSGSNIAHISVYNMNYTWCWSDVVPKLRRPYGMSWSTNSTTGGWGENWTFIIEIKEPQNGSVNISAGFNSSSSSSAIFSQAGTAPCIGCGPTDYKNATVNSHVFTCSRDLNKIYYYKFNATDNESFTGSWGPDSGYSIFIERDDLQGVYVAGNATILNRGGGGDNFTSTLLIIKGNDTDNRSSIYNNTQVIFNINKDVTTTQQAIELSNTSGHWVYNLTPSCDYAVGMRQWWVTTNGYVEDFGENCYKTFDSRNYYNISVNITDDLVGTLWRPAAGELYDKNVNASIYFKATLKDDCNNRIGMATVNFSVVGPIAVSFSCLATPVGGEDGNFSCSYSSMSGLAEGYYNVTMYANKSDYLSVEVFSENAFYVKSPPSLKYANVSVRTGRWGQNWTFYINATDIGDDVTIWAWTKTTGAWEMLGTSKACVSCSETTLNWTTTFDCNDVGANKLFKFNATDTSGNTYETSTAVANDYFANDNTYTIGKDYLSVNYASGNGSTVTLYNPVTFAINVTDTDRLSYNFSLFAPLILFNVTNNTASFVYVNQTTVNASGYASVSFLPGDNFTRQETETWHGYVSPADDCYAVNQSVNATVYMVINRPPQYTNITIDRTTAGWGEGRNFTVYVKDFGSELDNITVAVQTDTGTGWINISLANCTQCNAWTQFNFTVNFSCSDINSTARYRVHAYDNSTNTNTSSAYTFSITKDNIFFDHIAGNGTIANRSGSQIDPLILKLRDKNNSYVGTGIASTLYISYSGPPGYVYDSGHALATNSSGHIQQDFDPTCTSPDYIVGPQMWYAGVDSASTCYYANLSRLYNTTIYEDFNLSILLPDGTINYTWGDSILHQGKVQDSCLNLIDYSTARFNISTGDNIYNFTPIGVGGGFYQGSWVSSGARQGPYNITFIVNKTYYYNNYSTKYYPQTFYLFTTPQLKYANTSLRSGGWGEGDVYNFSILVTDESGDNVGVKFWEKKSGGSWVQVNGEKNCTSCSNTTLSWVRNYTCGDIGSWNFKFTGQDLSGNQKETSIVSGDYVSNDDSYIIGKNNV